MSDRRCTRCGTSHPAPTTCEQDTDTFWASLNAKSNRLVAQMRANHAKRNQWATGGGGRGLHPISEDLEGVMEVAREAMNRPKDRALPDSYAQAQGAVPSV